jgi:hypothetical protein
MKLTPLVCFKFSAILFIAFSCKKDPIQYVFEGKITESFAGGSLPGVSIKINQKLIKNGATSENFTTATSTESSASGEYAVSFNREMISEFQFKFTKENYFPIEFNSSSSNYTTDGSNVINQTMDPMSWISFDLLNEFGEDTDHIKLITQTFRENCEGCTENTTYNIYGTIDSTITFPTTGGTYARFVYINVTTGFSVIDSLYATPFETNVYPIVY